jgi:hypothetical protein
MTFFSDIQREEAIAICQLLISAGRADMVVPALKKGLTLDDVRLQLATAAPAPPAADVPRSPNVGARPAVSVGWQELEAAGQARFAAQRRNHWDEGR